MKEKTSYIATDDWIISLEGIVAIQKAITDMEKFYLCITYAGGAEIAFLFDKKEDRDSLFYRLFRELGVNLSPG